MRIDMGRLEFVDSTLREIAVTVESSTGLEFTITSLYRMGDSGVHGQLPLRGLDLRMRSKAIGAEVEALINGTWQYDSERPHMQCALLHGEGPNLHLHIQTHPRTVRRV